MNAHKKAKPQGQKISYTRKEAEKKQAPEPPKTPAHPVSDPQPRPASIPELQGDPQTLDRPQARGSTDSGQATDLHDTAQDTVSGNRDIQSPTIPQVPLMEIHADSGSQPHPQPGSGGRLLRWKLVVTCTNTSPMHIGDGAVFSTSIQDMNGQSTEVTVRSICKDGSGKPWIPGSTLKGCIRSAMESSGTDAAKLDTILGYINIKTGNTTESHIGAVTFAGGWFEKPGPVHTSLINPDTTYGSYIEIFNAHDRVTGSVDDGKLFYMETLAPGCTFRLEFIVTGSSVDTTITDAILRALQSPRFALGADTAKGWGRLHVDSCRTKGIYASQIEALVTGMPGKCSFPGWSDIGTLTLPVITTAEQSWTEGFLVELDFQTPMLSMAPKAAETDEGTQIRVPRKKHSGTGYLIPESSIKGPFRAQAERILRTLGIGACDPTDQKGSACKDPNTLCPACQLFGGVGMKSLLEFSDLQVTPRTQPTQDQEFVAIDRFHGGAADKKKFAARPLMKPVVTLKLRFNRRPEGWMKALTALTLRDLHDGDIRFGWGKTKGYGRAVIGNWETLRTTGILAGITQEDFTDLTTMANPPATQGGH